MHTTTSTPTGRYLADALHWLKAEQEALGSGFYCNRDVITKCFEEGRACCVLEGEAVVGFGTYQVSDDESKILIVEVHPEYRGRGYGTALAEELFSVIVGRRARRVEVECIPPTSERFWRSRGFGDYEAERDRRGPNGGVHLRKALYQAPARQS